MSERTRIDMAGTAREWAQRGFSCDVWVDPPGQVWSGFVHDVDELLLMDTGNIVLEMQGRVLRLGPGDEVTIPAGTRHTVRNVGDGAARWLYGYRRPAQSSET